jgi:hypothetical protein
MSDAPWQPLVSALELELERLQALHAVAREGREPLLKLDVAEVEAWAARKQAALDALADASRSRAAIQDELLPAPARGASGSGSLAAAVTLQALLARASETIATRLRQLRDGLRAERDALALVLARNDALARQVLQFTRERAGGLAESTRAPVYDGSGRRSEAPSTGELFRRSI